MTAQVFSGRTLFELKASHGFPLDFALVKLAGEGLAVDWPEYIEAARSNGRWDFQTYREVCDAIAEAQLPAGVQAAIREGFQRYVLAHPMPTQDLTNRPS